MAKKLSLFQRIKQALFGTPKKEAPAPAPTPGPSMQTLYRSHQERIAAIEARAAAYAAKPRSQRIGEIRPEDEDALFWRLYDGMVE